MTRPTAKLSSKGTEKADRKKRNEKKSETKATSSVPQTNQKLNQTKGNRYRRTEPTYQLMTLASTHIGMHTTRPTDPCMCIKTETAARATNGRRRSIKCRRRRRRRQNETPSAEYQGRPLLSHSNHNSGNPQVPATTNNSMRRAGSRLVVASE